MAVANSPLLDRSSPDRFLVPDLPGYRLITPGWLARVRAGPRVVGPVAASLGQTPPSLRPRRDLGKLQVLLRAPGYAPVTLLLDYSEDCDRKVVLAPVASGGAQ